MAAGVASGVGREASASASASVMGTMGCCGAMTSAYVPPEVGTGFEADAGACGAEVMGTTDCCVAIVSEYDPEVETVEFDDAGAC
jgi:hypothetical protein